MAGNGNPAEEFEWVVSRRDNDEIVKGGLSKHQSRSEYKDTVRECSRRGIFVKIGIDANSKPARETAKNIRNDQTLLFGVGVKWKNISEYKALGLTYFMTKAEKCARLSRMSNQDRQEPKFRKMCLKYGIKFGRYTPGRLEHHGRGKVVRRPSVSSRSFIGGKK